MGEFRLGTAQSLFEFFAFRDVLAQTDHPDWFTLRVTKGLPFALEPPHLAILASNSVFHVQFPAGVERRPNRRVQAVPIVRMNELQDACRCQVQTVWLKTKDSSVRFRPPEGVPGDIPVPDARAGRLLGQPELLLTLPESLLRKVALFNFGDEFSVGPCEIRCPLFNAKL